MNISSNAQARKLIQLGYRGIVPVYYKGKKPAGGRDWPDKLITVENVDQRVPEGENWNLGLLSTETSVVDGDVTDPAAGPELMELAHQRWPQGVTRIGASPKFAMLFRPPTEPFTISKLVVWKGDPKKCGVKAEVDIRTSERTQSVVLGVHRDTCEDYYYPGKHLLDVPADQLPVLTREDTEAFLAGAEAILTKYGYARLEKSTKPPRAPQDAPAEVTLHDRKTVLLGLQTGENRLDDYDDWVTFGLALKTVFGQDDIPMRDAWIMWSEQWPQDKEDPAEKWDQDDNLSGDLTLGSIYYYLDQNGFDWRMARHEKATEDAALSGAAMILNRPRKGLRHAVETTPPPEFAVDGWFPRGLVSSLYGADGTGKSTLVLRLLIEMATGRSVLGEDPSPPMKVWFLSVEDPYDAVMERMRAMARSMGVTEHEWNLIEENLLIPDLMMADTTILDQKGEIGAFRKAIDAAIDQDGAPKVMVLDPISDLHDINENDRAMVRKFMKTLIQLAHQHKMAIILLGHPAKSEGSTYSGSTAWSSKVRSRLWMENINDAVHVSHEKASYRKRKETKVYTWDQHGTLRMMSDHEQQSHLVDRVKEVQLAILDMLPVFINRDVAVNLNARSPAYLPKMMRAEETYDEVPPDLIHKVADAMIDDTALIASVKFDGKDGRPERRAPSRHCRQGIWFGPRAEALRTRLTFKFPDW